MPCNTITTQSTNLAKALPILVKKTLETLGWKIQISSTVVITARKGYDTLKWYKDKGLEITTPNATKIITNITKEYSKQAVTWAASRAGWKVSNTGSNKLTATRR